MIVLGFPSGFTFPKYRVLEVGMYRVEKDS
jgi:hypothetical protein